MDITGWSLIRLLTNLRQAGRRAATSLLLVCLPMFSQETGIRILVQEGQGALNNITLGTTWEPVVQVVDAQGRPVQGATVTYSLPERGPGASFTDGSKTSIVVTGADGRAVANGLKPNNVAGQFEIRVLASYRGQTARAAIPQTNVASRRRESGNSRKLLILGLIAGAAAGGIFAATSGGGSSSASPAPPPTPSANPTPIAVVPGQPGFGPPR